MTDAQMNQLADLDEAMAAAQLRGDVKEVERISARIAELLGE